MSTKIFYKKKTTHTVVSLNKVRCIIGIDEVGRGALAGPVVVAAVAVVGDMTFRVRRLGKLKDSKKLSKKQREAWFQYLIAHPKIFYAVAYVSPKIIDAINISRAANRAALQAFHRLPKRYTLHLTRYKVLLDGGLFLGNGDQISNAKTIIKADEKYNAVKAASIIAKVTRDEYMVRLTKQFPRYGFHIHKGYGTKKHCAALRRYGHCQIHRLTFIGFLKNSKP